MVKVRIVVLNICTVALKFSYSTAEDSYSVVEGSYTGA